MDYNAIHGQDVSNISSPSPHRMPTVSAARALQDLLSPTRKAISTGLPSLDAALQSSRFQIQDPAGGNEAVIEDGGNRVDAGLEDRGSGGGVELEKVTEIYGPPGVGKTALGMQIAVNVLRDGGGVIWIDAANPVPILRVKKLAEKSHDESLSTETIPPTDLLSRFIHMSVQTLPHLIALLCHPMPSFPPDETRLIVIDSLSTLISNAYPRTNDSTSTPRRRGTAAKQNAEHWASTRKWAVLQYLVSSFQKLATIHNLAIVITNQTVTKLQPGSAAMLVPAVTSTAWAAGLSARIMLYRDWGWEGKKVRFAAIQKEEPVGENGGLGSSVVAFTIDDNGLEEVVIPDITFLPGGEDATPSRKRKRCEIGDTDDDELLEEGSDEDYGWENEDAEELPEQPSQFQGSEDVLIPYGEEIEEEVEEGVEEEVGEEEDELEELEIPASDDEDEDELRELVVHS